MRRHTEAPGGTAVSLVHPLGFALAYDKVRPQAGPKCRDARFLFNRYFKPFVPDCLIPLDVSHLNLMWRWPGPVQPSVASKLK